MSFTHFDHLVILVNNIDEGIATWRETLGMTLHHQTSLPSAGIAQAFFSLTDKSFIELVAPSNDKSPVAEVIRKQGEGVHVVALRVDDLEESVVQLQQRGATLTGVGTPQVFVHPSSSTGVMLQLWPKNRPHRWRDNPSEAEK